ncbi:hypothetical protein [Vibrio coralliilyticus]|uniref:hypothetical protein n=1 Tax=Vibrio coralliilyticus TaxID=190893 RepID=UPI001E2A5B02|nr:hypothetical protein [Vibrio coralliilyticus]MCC2524991.1 hypothetical protein [Vibrio coralliilyticus]
MLWSGLLSILGLLVFIIGGITSGWLFFYGIYVLIVSSIVNGLIFIGASVVLTIVTRLVSAALSGLGAMVGSRIIDKQIQDEKQSLHPDSSSDDGSLIQLKGTALSLGTNQIQQGKDIADDCFKNGLTSGKVVKLNEIEQSILDNYEYMPNAVINGFLQRMQEYIDSGVVLNLSIQGEGPVFVHRDHAGFLEYYKNS